MSYKKLCTIVLVYVLLVVSVFTSFVSVAVADSDPYFSDGAIRFETISKKAVTDITYHTVGFIIHREPRCKNNKTICEPRNGDYGEVTLTQVGEDEDIGGGMVKTTFVVPQKLVDAALKKAKLDQIKDDDEIWLSAVFEVLHKGKRYGSLKYTLEEIKKAESWGDPNSFGQYYDKKTTFKSGKYPVDAYYIKEGGSINSSLKKVHVGDVKNKEEISYKFENPFMKGQKKYEIVRSYITTSDDPIRKFIEEAGSPKVQDRSVYTYLTGVQIIAEFREVTIPDPEGKGDCTWTIEPPSLGAAPQYTVMNPLANGDILADDASNDRIHFEAKQGIPTSEHLFAKTVGLNYLYQHTFGNMKGKVRYQCKVDVTYVLKWKEKPDSTTDEAGNPVVLPDIDMSETETKTYNFDFTRDYSYWQINNLEVYSINRALMRNYALPGEEVTLWPDYSYNPPELEMSNSNDVEDHVEPKDTGELSYTPPEVDKGGYTKPSPPDDTSLLKGMAESQTDDPDVHNDSVIFNDQTIMDDATVTSSGPTPGSIPPPSKIGGRVLYEDHLLISSSLLNKADTESTGTIYYDLLPENVGGTENKEFAITPINSVTVHTPVVNYSSVSDDEAHNQKTVPNSNRSALILERPFKVRIPTSGQHLNDSSYPGYGDRDYEKYFRSKQVRFTFDVYNGGQTQFIPKDTWIDIPVNQLETTFFLPVWVDEGDYQVYFRNIAENAPNSLPYERDANLDLINHVAVDEVSVEVIGRLYDFHITDIADYNWEEVFRTSKKSSQSTGKSYWVGMGDIDGQPRGNTSPYTLPILPGSHPLQGYKNLAIKTGYHFKFDLKTKGNMFGKQDQIRITPSFYFVSRDGKEQKPVEVDLYYRTNSRPFVRIGSEQDQVSRYVILNERLRNVPAEPLIDTARYKFDHYAILSSLTREQYVEQYINKLTKQKIPVGSFSLLKLPEQLRTFIGPKTTYLKGNLPSSVDAQRANASIQRWYGEYSLPAAPFVVLKGDSLGKYGPIDDKSKVFLQNKYKNGYIIVNFDIESIPNGDADQPHLQYINAPAMNETRIDKIGMNQWEMEGFQSTIQDAYGNTFNLKNGDIVFYHGNKSSRDDFSSQVTH